MFRSLKALKINSVAPTASKLFSGNLTRGVVAESPASSDSAAIEPEQMEDTAKLKGPDGVDGSRKGFHLDPDDMTHSRRDEHGCWMNPWPTWKFPSNLSLLRFFLLDQDNSDLPANIEILDSQLPVLQPYFVKSPAMCDASSGLRVTWLGHASVLVELDGLNILTDPIFSQRASPVQFMGPKRFRGPPCSVAQLPKIHAVLISHSHYDHLDLSTVRSLNSRFGSELRWFVPLGLLDWMVKVGCEDVVELDWWEQNCVPGRDDVSFVCTPAQHWSKRTPLDTNKALWGSWSVIGPKHRFFFAGDTGYCSSFKEIGRQFGPFDLAAIPIGAYQPREVMKGQHVDPEEAVTIHQDVHAKQSVAIHWGTFALAHEFYLEPPQRLREVMKQKGLDPESFFPLSHGESRLISEQPEQ